MFSSVHSFKQPALFSSRHLAASFALIAYACYSSFQLLILCAAVNGASTVSSNCTSSSMKCANLSKISYPFWDSAACAASPRYVLSNCSSNSSSTTEAHWDSLIFPAAHGVTGPPTVTAADVLESSIQLSWNTSLDRLGYCAPLFSSHNLSLYSIPSFINLTSFSSNTFTLGFSSSNTFLLFGCSAKHFNKLSSVGDFLTESESGCRQYKGLCTNQKEMPCIEWRPPPSAQMLMLQEVLDKLTCTHFMLGVAAGSEYGGNIDGWSTGSIELVWSELQCSKCKLEYGGCCRMDAVFPTKFGQCICSDGREINLDTETSCEEMEEDYNIGVNIRSTILVALGLLIGVFLIAVGLLLARRFRHNLHSLGKKVAEIIRNAYVCFARVTVPIAINVLKGALRKLQLSNYGSRSSFRGMDFDELTERPMEYSYGTLASATKSFTTLLGEGGFSLVYKGTLAQASSSEDSNLQIAVKVLDIKSKHSKQQLLNEVITIGRIHHVSVVRLLGFCMRGDYEILVYEYVENGSLDKWLFADKETATMDKVLGWGKRYSVALEVARGLSYLHEECRHRTVHCDIKPQNILLDKNMHPKIADFGLARLMGRDQSKVMTFAKGTPGYMAPEFWIGGESELSTKIDVYGYGMVLLELISGRRNFSHNVMLNATSSIPALAYKAAMDNDMRAILDSRLSINEADGDETAQWDQVKKAVLVALWCIQDRPESRPQMSEVVKFLEGGAAVSESPPQPNIATFYGSTNVQVERSSSNPIETSSSYPYETDTTSLDVGR